MATNTLSRIYQGRINHVEMVDGKTTRDLYNWEARLWDHHALFQDAVNYYLVCLLSLVHKEDNPLWGIHQQIVNPTGPDYAIWQDFRRNGRGRKGMAKSVSPYLTPDKENPSPQECFDAIARGGDEQYANKGPTPEQQDAALCQVLEECGGPAGIQQKGREVLPRLCVAEYKGKFSDTKKRKDLYVDLIATWLAEAKKSGDIKKLLDNLDFAMLANINEEAEPCTGDEAKAFLAKEWEKLTAPPFKEEILKKIDDLPKDTTIPAFQGGSVNRQALRTRLVLYLILLHVEQSERVLDLLIEAYPQADSEKAKKANASLNDLAVDPIKAARAKRGFLFRAFTSLPKFNPDNTPSPKWKEFDIAAFKEALTALHQVESKTAERNKEREGLEARHDYMRGQVKKWAGDKEEGERPAVLAGDPRIKQLEAVLAELRSEYDLVEGETADYGLHPRTIKGFSKIRKMWRENIKRGQAADKAAEQKVRQALRDYQKKNPENIGSVLLFEKLVEPGNWIIWQEPDEATAKTWKTAGYANDPLKALTEERELLEDIERLKQPVRLTPADPRYSRRQYRFTDDSGCKHDGKAMRFECWLAVNNGTGLWERKKVRLSYSAPRFRRDGLRGPDDQLENDSVAQPMLQALAPKASMPSVSKTAVCLMPDVLASGQKRFLLNFPVTFNVDELQESLGIANKWNKEFHAFGKGASRKRVSLLWPDMDKRVAWHKDGKPFHCLAADLGQRDAAAFAIIECAPGKDEAGKGHLLGETNGTIWFAHLKDTGILRLPGEDARVLRDGAWQQEFYGEKGRSASPEEYEEGLAICRSLGYEGEKAFSLMGEAADTYSFPEQNDRLLLALRWAKNRLLRLHGWTWMLGAEEGDWREKALRAIADSDDALLNGLPDNPVVLKEALITGLIQDRRAVTAALETVADRVFPLRDKRWRFRSRGDGSECHVLLQEDMSLGSNRRRRQGQRGLSIKRIEQFEALRRVCQGLNRHLMNMPGKRAAMGREARGVELPDPCPDILERMDRIREQRVNQTAHMILAQALGVRLRKPAKSVEIRRRADIHGEYECIPGRKPVDFIVLEDLARYLSSQGRSRRENSRLMKWCHRAILGKVKELAEPFGIPVLETPAAYSSRFSSRDGCPGFRAQEVSPQTLRKFPWTKYVENNSNTNRMTCTAADKPFRELAKVILDINQGRAEAGKPPRALLAPQNGGPIFIPIGGSAMQADINAAINLGLRAIAHPERSDIHHRIRTIKKGGNIVVRRDNKSEKAAWDNGTKVILSDNSALAKLSAFPNFFYVADSVSNLASGKIDDMPVAAQSGFWAAVRKKEWAEVNRLNNLRLEKWGIEAPLGKKPVEEEEDEGDWY